MIADIHDPLPYEREYFINHKIATSSTEEIKNGAKEIMEWIAKEKIEYLAIHLDLNVLDPSLFRSVLSARKGEHDFGDVAEEN